MQLANSIHRLRSRNRRFAFVRVMKCPAGPKPPENGVTYSWVRKNDLADRRGRGLPCSPTHQKRKFSSWPLRRSWCWRSAEDRADAGRNARHDSACGDRDETCHQSIFNEVLASGIVPNSQLPNQISYPCHFLCLLYPRDEFPPPLRVSYHLKPV